MRKQAVSSSGWELFWNVPESADEYNSLAPKRNNPVLEDAINSTWYRSGANKFRDALCTHLESVTGVARINSGTEDKPEWEKEGVYIKRAIATHLEKQGLDPSAKANVENFRNSQQAAVQSLLDAIVFDPSEREASGTAPTIAKTYTAWAAQAVATDGGTKLAGLLSKVLNAPVTLTGDGAADTLTLAKAIAANEKRKRDAAQAEYTG